MSFFFEIKVEAKIVAKWNTILSSFIGLMTVAFSILVKEQKWDLDLFLGALIMMLVLPLVFGFITLFLIKRNRKCHLIINTDYVILFVNDIETGRRSTKNFLRFKNFWFIPTHVMLFSNEPDLEIPQILGMKTLKIFKIVKEIQLNKKMDKSRIIFEWFDTMRK